MLHAIRTIPRNSAKFRAFLHNAAQIENSCVQFHATEFLLDINIEYWSIFARTDYHNRTVTLKKTVNTVNEQIDQFLERTTTWKIWTWPVLHNTFTVWSSVIATKFGFRNGWKINKYINSFTILFSIQQKRLQKTLNINFMNQIKCAHHQPLACHIERWWMCWEKGEFETMELMIVYLNQFVL